MNKESTVFDFMRFPLIVMIIFIHCQGVEVNLQINHLELLDNIKFFFSGILTPAAVPCFFFISVFFCFYKYKSYHIDDYLKLLKRKAKTLVIPYFSWIFIAFLLSVMFNTAISLEAGGALFDPLKKIQELGGWHMFWDYSKWGTDRTNWLGLSQMMTGPYVGPLWFLRDLIIMFMLSPIIYRFLNWSRQIGVILLFCCFISGIWPNVPGLTITTVTFFSLGAYFGITKESPIAIVEKCEYVNYIVTAILGIFYFKYSGRSTEIGNVIYPFYVITLFISYMALASRMSKKYQMNKLLSSSSFFIYLIHTIICIPVCKLVINKLIATNSFFIGLGKYFLYVLMVASLSFAIYVFIKKTAPKLLTALSGGR